MARDTEPGSIGNPDPNTGGNPYTLFHNTDATGPPGTSPTGYPGSNTDYTGGGGGGGGNGNSTGLSRILGYDAKTDEYIILDAKGEPVRMNRATAEATSGITPSDLDVTKAQALNAIKTLNTYGQYHAIGFDGKGGVLVQGGDGTIATVSEADVAGGKYPGVSNFDVMQVKGEYQRYQTILNSAGAYEVSGTDAKGNITLKKGDGTYVTVNKADALSGKYPGIAASDVQQALIKQNQANFDSGDAQDYGAMIANGQSTAYQGLDTSVPAAGTTAPGTPVPGTETGGSPPNGLGPTATGAESGGGTPAMPGSVAASGNPWAPNIPANRPPEQPGSATAAGGETGGAQGGLGGGREVPLSTDNSGSTAGATGASAQGTADSSGGMMGAGAQSTGNSGASIPGFGAARPAATRGQTFSGAGYHGSQQNLDLTNRGMQSYWQNGDLQFRIANQGRQQAADSNELATRIGTAIRAGQGRSFEGMGPLRGSTVVGQ